MAIALHPYLIGVPHRIGAFDAALKYICKHKKVWKATGSEIARHYLAQIGGRSISRPRTCAQEDGDAGPWSQRCWRRCCFVRLLLAAPAARAAETSRSAPSARPRPIIWPVFIGIKKGFFAAEDLKVDIVYVQSSANLVQQLAAGSLDITMSTGLVDPIRAIGARARRSRSSRVEVQAPPYALLAKSAHQGA